MSSDSYANRLSNYKNKGKCGLPESNESVRSLRIKLKKLAKMMKESNYVVVLTGAAAGIPDFRGPRGIWTIEQQNNLKNNLLITTGNYYNLPNVNIKQSKSGLQNRLSRLSNPPSNFNPQPIDFNIFSLRDIEYSNTSLISNLHHTVPPEITSIAFESALPTATHSSITKLIKAGIIKYCITQNVDGLHMKSGLSRKNYSFLHGCVFTEKCDKCQTEYFRSFDVGGIRRQKTGRTCTKSDCTGDLRDTLLDWEDELPPQDWSKSQKQCIKSDLVIALGTSLRIEPVGSLPLLAKKFVIVNKQVTPYDMFATLVIRAPVDEVMYDVMSNLKCS